MKARVITPWIGSGTSDDPYTAQVGQVFKLQKLSDVTDQRGDMLLPAPNLSVVEVECDEATLNAIKTDSRFKVLHDSVTLPTNVPAAAEFGLLVAYLGTHRVAQNVARSIIGRNPAGRTRAQIAEELRLWLATRPRAEESVKKLDTQVDKKLDINPVPMVKIWRWTIPLSSVWTWEHIIQPVVRWWNGA